MAGAPLLTPDTAATEVYPLHYAAAVGDARLLQQLLDDAVAALDHKPKSARGSRANAAGSASSRASASSSSSSSSAPRRRRGSPSHFTVDASDGLGRTPLVYAIVKDSHVCAALLISRGANLNAPDSEGRTPLHWACYHAKAKMVKLLLAQGADPCAVDKDQRSLLHLCAHHTDAKTMKLILKAQQSTAQLEVEDNYGMRPLHWAAHHGNVEQVKLLLSKGQARCFVVDKEGKTPLHWAVGAGKLECVKVILHYWRHADSRHATETKLEQATFANHADHEKRTALHMAASVSDVKIVKALLQVPGINFLAQDDLQRTPLHWAAFLNHAAHASALLSAGGPAQAAALDSNGQSPLHYATLERHLPVVTAICKYPGVQDVPDPSGSTPLMMAAIMGDVAIALKLIHSNACNVNARDNAGSTVLHVAAFYNRVELLEPLRMAGADINAVDQHGQTPLFHACGSGHREVAQSLIDHGATVAGRDAEGRSPLHWAAVGGHDDICALLLSRGADANAADEAGRTPLHNAAFGDHVRVVEVLLHAEAAIDQQDDAGITALHWAASVGGSQVIDLLLQAGAYVNMTEYHPERLTPLDYALMAGHEDAANQLRAAQAMGAAEVRAMAAWHLQAWYRSHTVRASLVPLLQEQLHGLQEEAELRWQQRELLREQESEKEREDRLAKEAEERERQRVLREAEEAAAKLRQQEAEAERHRREEEAQRAAEEAERQRQQQEAEAAAAAAAAAEQRRLAEMAAAEEHQRAQAAEQARQHSAAAHAAAKRATLGAITAALSAITEATLFETPRILCSSVSPAPSPSPLPTTTEEPEVEARSAVKLRSNPRALSRSTPGSAGSTRSTRSTHSVNLPAIHKHKREGPEGGKRRRSKLASIGGGSGGGHTKNKDGKGSSAVVALPALVKDEAVEQPAATSANDLSAIVQPQQQAAAQPTKSEKCAVVAAEPVSASAELPQPAAMPSRPSSAQRSVAAPLSAGSGGRKPMLMLSSMFSAQARAAARQERLRLQHLRKKIRAAVIIQRCYRRWCRRKQQLLAAGSFKRARPYALVERHQEGPSKLRLDPCDKRQQIAALTIQLSWRRFLSRQGLKMRAARQFYAGDGGAIPRWAMTACTQDDRAVRLRHAIRLEQQRQAYLQPMPAVVTWHPQPVHMIRPLELQTMASPAAVSYNLALTTYAEPLLDVQRLRIADAERILRQTTAKSAQLPEIEIVSSPGLEQRRPSTVDVDTIVPPTPGSVRSWALTDMESQNKFFSDSMNSSLFSSMKRSLPASPNTARRKLDPHEILRRHQEKRRLEQKQETQSMSGRSNLERGYLASSFPHLPPLSPAGSMEVVMDCKARQAALQKYRQQLADREASVSQV